LTASSEFHPTVASHWVNLVFEPVNAGVGTIVDHRQLGVEPTHDNISPNDMASRPPPTKVVVNVEGIVASTMVVPVFT
jgi:hypothetical protein